MSTTDDLIEKTFAVGKRMMVEIEIVNTKEAQEWIRYCLDREAPLLVGAKVLRLDVIDHVTHAKEFFKDSQDVLAKYGRYFGNDQNIYEASRYEFQEEERKRQEQFPREEIPRP